MKKCQEIVRKMEILVCLDYKALEHNYKARMYKFPIEVTLLKLLNELYYNIITV